MNQLAPITLLPGVSLYKYHLIGELGQGKFGKVWLAKDTTLKREFAVKILNPGVSIDERLREAQIGNRLTHGNLVHVHHADVLNVDGSDVVFIAMDFQLKGSIEHLANPGGFLPLPRALRIAQDILQGLDYLHTHNFLHNDIKPGNILLGNQQQAMLSDYGIAGVSIGGSPAAVPGAYTLHCAPELHSTQKAEVRTDIFQVGMTLVRLLIGLNYLDMLWMSFGEAEYMQRVGNGSLLTKKDFPGHIPPAVRRVVLKAIHPDAAQRYASSLDMRRAIEKLNFPGYWDVDESGQEYGVAGAYRFEFELSPVGSNRFDLSCTRRKGTSGNKQRITRHCRKKLTPKQACMAIAKFKQSVVVTGK